MSLKNLTNKLEQKKAELAARASPVSNAIRGVNTGIGNAKSAVSGVVGSVNDTFGQLSTLGKTFTGLGDTAGKTISGISDTASGAVASVQESFGNAFGGKNDVAKNPVPTNGSGEGGAAPSPRLGGFATNPSEVLPSLDPVKRAVSEPFKAINEQAEAVMDYLDPNKAGSLLDKGWTTINDLVTSVETAVAPIKSRIESSLDMIGQVASLPDRVMNQVSSIVSAASQVENGVQAVIDGVNHTFKSFESLAHYTAINRFISDYASVDRETDTLDVEALRALIISMGQTMIAEGQQAKIEEIISRIPDEAVRLDICDELIVVAATLGYVAGLEYYEPKLGTRHGQLVAEKVIRGTLSNLSLEKGDTYKNLGTRMLAVFEKLKPQWNVSALTKRIELMHYTYCNANALTALAYTAHRPFAVAGGNVKRLTPTEMVSKFFPL